MFEFPEIAFICDRKACGDVCPDLSCSRTLDINHAKHFKRIGDRKYMEFEESDEKTYTDIADAQSDIDMLRYNIEQSFPKSRELSLVLTKLDEAKLWLGALDSNKE